MMKKAWIVTLTACLGLALFSLPVQAETTIQILHASDLEGGVAAIGHAPNFAAVVDKLKTTQPRTLIISAGDNYLSGPFFTASADRSVRDALRKELNNKDAREGAGRVDISIMNIMGFQASAMGNHEFDLGTGPIKDIIAPDIRQKKGKTEVRWLGAQFPYLSANLDFSGDKNLSKLYTDKLLPNTAFASSMSDLAAAQKAPKISWGTVVDLDGVKIGIVGGTTPMLETISSPGATKIKDPGRGTNDMAALAKIIQPRIDALAQAGVKIIVLTSHLQQIQLEHKLAALLKGVDVIIAGGSDTLLADADDVARGLRPGHKPAGGYPLMAKDADGKPVAIVSTDGQYTYVGRLTASFSDAGELLPQSIKAADCGAYATTEKVVAGLWGGMDKALAPGTMGAKVAALTGAVKKVVMEKDGKAFGQSAVYLNGARVSVRTQETNLGNLSADANLWAARQADPKVAVSIKNGGGIRESIGSVIKKAGSYVYGPPQANSLAGKKAGWVSQLDIESSLRFNNRLSLLTLSVKDLKAVIEHGVAAWAVGATPGSFPQVGGIAFSFDPSKPAGSRVVSMALCGQDGKAKEALVKDGKVVGDPSRGIRVVTLDFMAKGGDGYPFNKLGKDVKHSAIGEQKAMADYLAKFYADKPYQAKDTAITADTRIQNLKARKDTVL